MCERRNDTWDDWESEVVREVFRQALDFRSLENLYGTTVNAGSSAEGTVFAVSATGKESILHSFAGSPDGANPWAGLVRDDKDNLYGAAFWGGTFGEGTWRSPSSSRTTPPKLLCPSSKPVREPKRNRVVSLPLLLTSKTA
jgi:uncharacterized repeat protein (TIGR03803 family)